MGNMMRLKEIRKSRGLKQVEVAAALGIDLTNYNKLENGHTELTLSRMQDLSEILHCAPADFISDRTGFRFVEVRQFVQAGNWAESLLWDQEDWYEVAIPDHASYRNLTLHAAKTRGPSMNKRYPEGSALIYTSIIETREKVEAGRRYIIEIERSDGMREATVKTLWQDETGKSWLLPESTDPRHQQPIDPAANDEETVRIVGRIIYSIQPEE
jgi:transcriptional regulator with XRE-family HTH domain